MGVPLECAQRVAKPGAAGTEARRQRYFPASKN